MNFVTLGNSNDELKSFIQKFKQHGLKVNSCLCNTQPSSLKQ